MINDIVLVCEKESAEGKNEREKFEKKWSFCMRENPDRNEFIEYIGKGTMEYVLTEVPAVTGSILALCLHANPDIGALDGKCFPSNYTIIWSPLCNNS